MMNKHKKELKIQEYRNGKWTQEQIETVKIITEGSDKIQELYDDKWTGMIQELDWKSICRLER